MLKPNELTFLTTCGHELRYWMHYPELNEGPLRFEGQDRYYPERCATYLAWESLTLLERGPSNAMGRPRTALARMSVQAAMRRNLAPPIDDFYPGDILDDEDGSVHVMDAVGCFEAETRFAHSLRKQNNDMPESNPACILLDINGLPIAYQKGNGKPTALTWREGYMSTMDGPKWVPKDALIRPLYEPGYDPRSMAADVPLVELKTSHVQTVHFLRFAVAAWLPESIAGKVLTQTSERIEQDVSDPDIQLGAKLSAERLWQGVVPLLDKAQRI